MVELDWRFLHSLNTVQSNRGTAGALQHACQADPVAIRSLALAVAIGYGPLNKARIMLDYREPNFVRPTDAEVEAALREIPRLFDTISGRANSGQRFTTTPILIKHLLDNGHSRTAAEWSLYELLQKGLLTLDDGHVEATASGNVIDKTVRDFAELVYNHFKPCRTFLRQFQVKTQSKPRDWHHSVVYSTRRLWNATKTKTQHHRPAEHSTDFRSVRWFGSEYVFTTTQAACVNVLWQNWEQGTPVISEVTILDEAGSAGDRLRDVFDKGKHPAYGTMITPVGKGAFRLTENNNP